MKSFLIPVFLLCLLAACNPRFTRHIVAEQPEALAANSVKVLGLEQEASEQAKLIGYVKAVDGSGGEDCEYYRIIDRFKATAAQAGANLIKITKHKESANCHSVWADLYLDPEIEKVVSVEPERIAEKLPPEPEPLKKLDRPYMITLEGGYVFKTAATAPGLSQYQEELVNEARWGKRYLADFTYFWNEAYGFSLRASQSLHTATVTLPPAVTGADIFIDEKVTERISFVAPGFTGRFASKKWILTTGAYLGYLEYRSLSEVFGVFATVRAQTVGAYSNLNVIYVFTENLGLQANLGYQTGIASTLRVNNGFRERRFRFSEGGEGLNNITAGLGLILIW